MKIVKSLLRSILLLWSFIIVWGFSYANDYEYKTLNIKADVKEDWTVNVQEIFVTNFLERRHWIIRMIPLNYSVQWKKFHIDISDVRVEWTKFITNRNGWDFEIKIWDANETVIWEITYPISYSTYWLIRNFSWMWYAELYWNLVWYDFDTSIGSVKTEINLPKKNSFKNDDFLVTVDWIRNSVWSFAWKLDWSSWDKIIITYDKWLSAYEWITLSVKFPKDYFNPDSTLVQDNSPSKVFPIMSSEDILKLKDKWVIRWPQKAKITIVEFTELLCPYCQRQSQQWTINDVIQQFPGQVNSISRPFIIHGETALQLSSALECVWELKPGVYYEVLDEAFWAYPVAMTGLVDIAVKNWVNEKSLQNCIDEWKYSQSIIDMMNFWSKLWVSWTPTSIIIDNESWKYDLIGWAYPIETFVEVVESLLN